MPTSHGLSIETDQLAGAAAKLDDIANRLHDLLQAEGPSLNAMPVGRDEVSARVAATLNDVQSSYSASALEGVTELREIAAALRASTGSVAGADADFTI